jgi:hypothetical protein
MIEAPAAGQSPTLKACDKKKTGRYAPGLPGCCISNARFERAPIWFFVAV